MFLILAAIIIALLIPLAKRRSLLEILTLSILFTVAGGFVLTISDQSSGDALAVIGWILLVGGLITGFVSFLLKE